MTKRRSEKLEWISAIILAVFISTVLIFPIPITSNPYFYPPVIQPTKPSVFPEIKDIVKKIEINLSTHKLILWEDERIVGEFLVSTGKSSTPTKTGEFLALTKLPVAYGGTYGQRWTMPYWIGIYNAGGQENGIHELPFINGVRESAWSLGHSISHGCVRLGIGEAELVYNWTDIGTPVIIHY